MNFEKEIQISLRTTTDSLDEAKKHPKITYTRDFLLSLSQLDVCKKLPSGFDRSKLSEFEDAYLRTQDRQRIPGSLPLQSYRRTEYGAFPPTRGDSGNYSRGVHGRWDNRSAGRSERDSDSQSDRDSESGRRYSNHSRRSWQSPEHDGLLGSGSFPGPSGYAAGLSAPKVRSSDHYQLNRSNEPYHPPRPYKAMPHTRRETRDSYNEETFGSTEYTSQDRAEEERRRRESFELMRKEQQKALQGKQNLNPDKHHDDILLELMKDTEEGKRVFNRCDELDESVLQLVSSNYSNRSLSQAPGSRPLVPPGFKSTILERNSSIGSLTHSHLAEVRRPEIEESLSHDKAVMQNGTSDNQEENQLAQKTGFREQQHEKTRIQSPSFNKGEHLEVSNDKLDTDNQLYRISSLSEDSEICVGSGGIDLNIKTVMGPKTIGDSEQNDSMSILEKLFDGALTMNLSESSGIIESRSTERDDSSSPSAIRTSKFAHWFLEDEKKLALDPSSSGPSDLLSLIVGVEKGRSQFSDTKAMKHMPSNLPFQSSELTDCNLEANVPSSTSGNSEKLYNSSAQEAVPTILTCEDLEQTIMSEYSVNFQGWNVSAAKTEESKANIDDCASQHLLSLLQKGTNLKDITGSLNLDGGPSDQLHVSDQAIVGSALETSREEKAENIHHSGKTLTLETLFGSAFMKELKSAEAPVSVQRGSIDSARTGISEPQESSFGAMGDGLFPITAGIGSNSSHESNVLQSGERQQSKSDKIGNWLGINNIQAKVGQPKNQNEKCDGNDGAIDIQLPEEESLFSVGNPMNSTNPIFMSMGSSNEEQLLFPTKPTDISEKLAALSTGFKDERPTTGRKSLPFIHGPQDPIGSDIRFHHVHSQPSSSQFHPQQNHVRPFLPSFNLHPNRVSSQMNLMPPEGIIHHDAPVSLQVPANMHCPPFHHSNTGPAGFDLSPHAMLQQMQMQNSFPPPHLLREYPRGGPLPPHPCSHGASFMQEPHPMQSYPSDQQQHNFIGSFGMPLQAPGSGGGSNHSEAFQQLLEMELRAKSKQIHPFARVGQSQEMYGHDLDLGFRYR